MIMLKDFSKKVVVSDKEALADLTNIIGAISFLITFCKKFDQILEKLKLKERVSTGRDDYIKTFSSFVWLLYVDAKNKVLNRSLDLIENTCMLAHCISFMLRFSFEYLIPTALINANLFGGKQTLSEGMKV